MADRSMRFGGGSSKPKGSVRTPDTLTSKDTVEVLLGISEGPIKGLVDGPKSFYADDTALVNQDGTPNFSNFQLDTWPGDEVGPPVLMALGGFSSPTTVSVVLAQNTPVVRSGSQVGINAVDYRVVVQQLMRQDDKGTYTAPLQIKFEYKALSSSTWLPAWAVADPSPIPPSPQVDGDDTSWTQYGNENMNAYSFMEDRQLYTSSGPPTNTPSDFNAVSFDVTGQRAYIWRTSDNTWQEAGLSDQGSFWTFTDAFDNSWRIYKQSTLNPADPRIGDLWINNPLALLIYNGGAWVMGNSSRSTPLTTLVDGVWSIDAKVSSNTAKDIRIYVPEIEEFYEFRVTKLSPDSATENFSVVQWESIQEIQRKPWSFHGVALAKILGQASDQFSGLPAWTGDWYGRIVKVPSNYDETARTYDGVWDGTFKLAWTNNPAFILQDFIENDRYGLSSVFLHTPNKWKFYEFGQYCDELIERPDGSFRPRWTYNEYITSPRDAKEMAQYIAGSAGALYIDDGNGNVDLVIDKDGPSIAIFQPENVGEDGFSYSYTDRLSRPNQIIVEFINPNLNWQPDKRIVQDDDDIATYGLITENFIAVGCTDVDEAIARARRRLIGGLTEKEIVTFTTNRQGKFLSEWDIILCADPDMGRGLTGRIHAVTGSRSVSLRDPVTIEPAISYTAVFTVVNPAYTPSGTEPPFLTVERVINTAPGVVTSLSFTADLPALPAYATFTLKAAGLVGFPKAFRVTNIQDNDGTGDNVVVTALELNRNKWTFIDTGVEVEDDSYNDHSGRVAPATNLRGEISYRPKGNITTRVLSLTWDKSQTSSSISYKVTHTRDGAVVSTIDTSALTCEFEGIDRGRHTFSVVATTMDGRSSAPAYYYYNLDGIQTLSPIQNLRLVNGTTENTFETLSPQFAWDPVVNEPNFASYEILIFAENGIDILRTMNVGQALTYTYGHTNNLEDHAGDPDRTFTFGVRAVDNLGVVSVPATLEVTNPPPPAPANLSVKVQIGGFLIGWRTLTNLPDFGGTRIYMSTTPGEPADEENLQFEGTGSSAVVSLPEAATWQILVGHYDQYKPTETIFATEVAQDVAILITDLQDDLQAAIDAAENINEFVSGVTENAEALAETLIQEVMRGADEIQKGELRDYIEGKTVGSIALETRVQTDTLVEFTDLIGVFNGDRSAIIIDRDKVMLSDTESLAQRDSLIDAKFAGTTTSFILETATAAADAAGAVATDVTLLGAKNDAGTAFVLNTGTAMVGAQTLAQYISSVSASAADGAVTTANANTTVAIAALSPTGGVPTATFLASVKSDLGSASSSVSFLLSSVAGNEAMAVLALNSNGRTTGFRANGVTGDFGIISNKFYIVDPGDNGNAKLPFLFTDGIAYLEQVVAKYIKTDTIETNHLKVGAVGATVYATGPTVGMSSGEASLVYASIYARGGMVQVLFYGSMTSDSTRRHVYLQLYRNGSAVGLPQHLSFDGEDTVPVTIVFTDLAATNEDDNVYEVKRTSGSGLSSFEPCSLTITNLRRFS
jgi:predicted phage tail protein